MDSNDGIQKVAEKAAGVDCSKAMEEIYVRIRKEVLRQLEMKRTKLTLQVAEMRVKVLEKTGKLDLLKERLRSEEQLVQAKRKQQQHLVVLLQAELDRREKLKKEFDEIRNRMQTTWSEYLKVYQQFPLAKKKDELEKKLKLRQFQNKYQTQKIKNKEQALEQLKQIKKMIRESREKQLADLSSGLAQDVDRIEELARIKREKLELISRLTAEKAERERQTQQLSQISSTAGRISRPLPVVTSSTLGQITLPTDAMNIFPSSRENNVLMSYNRRIIEECYVIVSPRRETTPPNIPNANYSSAQQNNNNTMTDYSTPKTGRGTVIDQPMEVEAATNSLVDLEYCGSSSSQNSSKDSFSQCDTAAELPQEQVASPEPTQLVHRPAGLTDSSQLAVTPAFSAQAPDLNIETQSFLRTTQVITCASSSQLRSRDINSTPAPLNSENDRAAEKTAQFIPTSNCSLGGVYPTSQQSFANATSSSQIRNISPAPPTPRAPLMQQNFASPAPRPALQNFATPEPRPALQNFASPALRPALRNFASPAPRPTLQNFASPAPRSAIQNFASPAPCPALRNFASPAPRPALQNLASPAPRPTHQNTASAARPIQQKTSSAALSSPKFTVNNSTLLPTRASSPATPSSSPTPKSSNRLAPSPKTTRFHPYASPRYDAFGKPGSIAAASMGGRASPVMRSTSQPTPEKQSSTSQNPETDEHHVSSQPQAVRPAHSMSAQVERTTLAALQSRSATPVANPEPQPVAITAAKPTLNTKQQATTNAEQNPGNAPADGEKSHYFNQQLPNSGNQAAVVNPESGKNDNVINLAESVPDHGDHDDEASGCSQEFNPPTFGDSDLGDEMTSPPLFTEEVEISPQRPFTSPVSDFETAEPANEFRVSNFGFSSFFGGSVNVAAKGQSSGQAKGKAPFGFEPAPTTNIFKLF